MIRDLRKVMMASISEVIEKMFYTAIDFDNDNDLNLAGFTDSSDIILASSIGYYGETAGTFIYMVPEEILITMTAGFLGEEPENITNNHTEGMVKEIINMIAGNVFSVSDNMECRLKIPELIPFQKGIDLVNDYANAELILAETTEGFMAVIHIAE
jgi:CheY-specific phosphatase CheX